MSKCRSVVFPDEGGRWQALLEGFLHQQLSATVSCNADASFEALQTFLEFVIADQGVPDCLQFRGGLTNSLEVKVLIPCLSERRRLLREGV